MWRSWVNQYLFVILLVGVPIMLAAVFSHFRRERL
jgi:hypothetical protein